MFKRTIILITVLSIPAFAYSDTIYVPDDYAKIQEAIDTAVNGDTVLVASGTYVENIDYLGKAITVKSESGPESTVIDGNQSGSVVTIVGAPEEAVLDGFTITNGTGTGDSSIMEGGGIYCEDSSLTIINNIVTGNSVTGSQAAHGGGFYCLFSKATILNNRITGNKAEETSFFGKGAGGSTHDSSPLSYSGAGGWTHGSEIVLANNIISSNFADGYGGGLLIKGDRIVVIDNNTISGNMASDGGGLAVGCREDGYAICSNTIFWNNESTTGIEISLMHSVFIPATFTISYCDVDGGKSSVFIGINHTLNWGPGMIDADPLFFNPAAGDYHLQQDPCQPGIVNPCVDTGNNLVIYNGYYSCSTKTNSDGDEGVVDMGFHYGSFTILDLALNMDTCFLSQGAGGTVNFKLSAGVDNKERNYLILGGASGTDPGTLLPGGLATIPINWDWFTDLELSLIGISPIFTGFLGKLDLSGNAKAQLIVQPLPPVALGVVMHYAYCCNDLFDYVSNPVEVEVVP